ncbi:MAG: protein translocase subunit SecD [Gemmatimonadota bacterium]|nr:MAG: protein translocase subunit SecD [Gemmatimonadota bacterium]
MLGTVRGRLIVIGVLLLLCGWALLPKEGPDGERESALKLGLDLQGGMHLAVEIDDPDGTLPPDAKADAVERTLTTIRNRIDEFGVREPTIQKIGDERIVVELAGIDDPDRAKAIVERTAFLEFKIVRSGEDFRRALPRIDRAIVRELGPENIEAVPIVEPEVPALSEILQGAAEGGDTATGPEGAPADTTPEAPGAAAPAAEDTTVEAGGQVATSELRPLTTLLLESGQVGQFLIREQDVPTAERYLALEAVRELVPRGAELKWGADPTAGGGESYRTLYVLEDTPLLTGEDLADAGPAARDPTFNQPYVPFETTRRGARKFERGTSQHVGDLMAIVLDDKVQSAPVIRQTLGRRAQIEMGTGSTLQEAQDLALVLRAGALPQPIRIVEERTVGPSLGADSVRQGKIAFVIGIIAVLFLMVAYYRVAGVMALIALGVYVILLLGGLAGLGATLTLPGIAGIILSIGMAVDANVLIFERIREEVEAGKTPRTAVETGFEQALSAIVDANLTTLITAIILFQFGTGPVRGFAVTLVIGILASFFSAIYVTRTLFMIYLDRRAAGSAISI